MEAVTDWKFLLLAAVINAVMVAIKRATKDACGSKPWYTRGLSLLPVVLGALLGAIPGVLSGGVVTRIMLGVLAGSFSSSSYAIVKKRARG